MGYFAAKHMSRLGSASLQGFGFVAQLANSEVHGLHAELKSPLQAQDE